MVQTYAGAHLHARAAAVALLRVFLSRMEHPAAVPFGWQPHG